MQGYNCIMIYNQERKKLLFCKRTKPPYQGLYNFIGGKIEMGENGYDAAYRELTEETGIKRLSIQLHHMMDFTYFNQDCYVEVYCGYLNSDVTLYEEAHPLVWLDVNDNFFDGTRFAGEGNIGHMAEQVKYYGMGILEYSEIPASKKELNLNSICIGVDGCKGGWIAAVLDHGKLIIDRYSSISDIVNSFSCFNEFLVDMVIGLPSKMEHIRPDTYARKIVSERTSTIFPAPCRQAVYSETIAEAYNQNEKVLRKKFTPLTVGIIPKIREIDAFLQDNPQYKNVIKESHPEVSFARLHGSTVLSKKSELDGMEERIRILSNYITDLSLNKIALVSKNLRCNIDDIIDAICLVITANMAVEENYEVIPECPMEDETGLKMQMIIPKFISKQL